VADDTNIVSWQVDGKRYDVDLYDIDGVEWRDAGRATGMTQRQIMYQALVVKDFDAIGALLWIVRRRAESGLAYEDVLRGLTYISLRNTAGGLVHEDPDDEPVDASTEVEPADPPG
jgi:hypothetical protein